MSAFVLWIVLAGLVIGLTALVIARNAGSGEPSPSRRPHVDPLVESDFFMWESRRIAQRGEDRAATLDFFGVLIAVAAVIVASAAILALATGRGSLTSDERLIIGLVAAGSVLFLIALAALFFGFGAVVRNTSRSLAIAAETALDITGPLDPE